MNLGYNKDYVQLFDHHGSFQIKLLGGRGL
jgi:hypothetical protein